MRDFFGMHDGVRSNVWHSPTYLDHEGNKHLEREYVSGYDVKIDSSVVSGETGHSGEHSHSRQRVRPDSLDTTADHLRQSQQRGGG